MANMAPTWVPRWSQNGEKIDAKIDQKFDASWDLFFGRILVDFGKENGGKLASQNDQKSKPPLKRKNQLNISGLNFSWLSGLQVGSKNRSKKQVNMGRHLGIDFGNILVDFGQQVGVQKGIEKVMKKRRSPRWQKKSQQKNPT